MYSQLHIYLFSIHVRYVLQHININNMLTSHIQRKQVNSSSLSLWNRTQKILYREKLSLFQEWNITNRCLHRIIVEYKFTIWLKFFTPRLQNTQECSDWTQNRVCNAHKYSMFKANLILDKEIIYSLTVSLISLAVGCLYLGTWFCASRRLVLDSYVLS